MEKVYTVDQTAKLLQVSIVSIRRYIKLRKLKASKLGKDYRILESDIQKFLKDTRN